VDDKNAAELKLANGEDGREYSIVFDNVSLSYDARC
jgi:hypothetical protein